MAKDSGYKELFIGENEKVLYHGEPYKKSRFMAQLTAIIIIALLCVAGDCFAVGVSIAVGIADKGSAWLVVVFVLCILIHIIPETIWLTNVLDEQTKLDSTEYFVTDKRIMTVSRKVDSYYLEQLAIDDVETVKIKRGAFDKLNGTANIIVLTKTDRVTLYSLTNGEKAFEAVKKLISFDDQTECEQTQTELTESDENITPEE